jgi:hypothetical protein
VALARADVAPLVALAHRIQHEGPCAQRRDIALLEQRAVHLVNSGRVPGELQDPLLSGVNALSADRPLCPPAVQPAATTTVGPPPPRPHGHGHEKHPKPHEPPHAHDHHANHHDKHGPHGDER